MKTIPSGACASGVKFTVADFYEAGRERLRLTLLVGGKGLSREIEEPMANRPGLALTGFFEHYASKRLQVIGNSEHAYMQSLPKAKRLEVIEAMIAHGTMCVIFTNGRKPDLDEIPQAEERGIVLMSTPFPTGDFIHNLTFVLERLGAPRTSLYGTMVEVHGLGIMFEGHPGLGKSETALGLVKRGHALVADDMTCIRKDVANDMLFGSASDSTAGFMEIRGIGIMHIPSVFGISSVRGEKRLHLVVTFKLLNQIKGEIDRVGQVRHYKTILGVKIPQVVIPVSEGRDLVNLVETAAQQQKVLLSGCDPVHELSERLRLRAVPNKPSVEVENRKRKGKINGR